MPKITDRDYIIYDKDDMPVFIGKVPACARFLGVSFPKVSEYACHTKTGRRSGKSGGYTVYRIEEEE